MHPDLYEYIFLLNFFFKAYDSLSVIYYLIFVTVCMDSVPTILLV